MFWLFDSGSLIYGGWTPHLCFFTEMIISKNQISSKSKYIKFKIINFKRYLMIK